MGLGAPDCGWIYSLTLFDIPLQKKSTIFSCNAATVLIKVREIINVLVDNSKQASVQVRAHSVGMTCTHQQAGWRTNQTCRHAKESSHGQSTRCEASRLHPATSEQVCVPPAQPASAVTHLRVLTLSRSDSRPENFLTSHSAAPPAQETFSFRAGDS